MIKKRKVEVFLYKEEVAESIISRGRYFTILVLLFDKNFGDNVAVLNVSLKDSLITIYIIDYRFIKEPCVEVDFDYLIVLTIKIIRITVNFKEVNNVGF